VARQRVAVCCSMCCSVLQCVAVCCSALQCVAVRCSVLQCVAVRCSVCIRSLSFILYINVFKSRTKFPENATPLPSIIQKTHLSRCTFNLELNLNLNLYGKIPKNLTFSIQWISIVNFFFKYTCL